MRDKSKKTADELISLAKSDFKNDSWLDEELMDSQFKDSRLASRFNQVLKKLWCNFGESIPLACQDWANTKAAYRFFSNERVNESHILQGHFESTKNRVNTSEGTLLVLQDTTEFSYQREKPKLIGITKSLPQGKNKLGEKKTYTQCGILMHSSLVVTPEGLPLGLAAIKLWTRKKFKGVNALKKKINPTRVPIDKKESVRWLENMKNANELLGNAKRCVHIGDRESDIYEFFCKAEELDTHFLIRACANRLVGDGTHTMEETMKNIDVKGKHVIEIMDRKGHLVPVSLEIKYHRVKVLPPHDKRKYYPDTWVTVIYARENKKPRGRPQIFWKLITNLSIKTKKDAIEKLNWYAMRWKIEIFHKILKSGCKAEESKLRTASRLANLIAVFCILSWRVFWLTMINRCAGSALPQIALTPMEIKLLDHLVKNKKSHQSYTNTLSSYLIKIARLGGYLARSSDPPPGNLVMWRGLSKLTDITLGFNLALELVGN